jgi:hypothetical protein
MSEREEFLNSFIEKIQLIFPTLIAVYEFDKEVAIFDKWLEGKKGIVIIINEEEYSLENLILIDLIYDKLQDEFGWTEGVVFASSFSRSYIRTTTNLWHINIKNNHCLLPEDQINLKNTRRLLYGTDIIPKIPFLHKEDEILKINIGLTHKQAKETASNFTEFKPLVDPECCWMRHDFTVDHTLLKILEEQLLKIQDNILPENNIHIYGRYGGSGKTQIMYSLIKECKKLELPFIYRSEFWKDETGRYKEIDNNPENEADLVSEWVANNAPGAKFVLFLDEVDINEVLLKDKLKEKFPDLDILFLIISGGKDIPDFTKFGFEIYDIVKEYPFSDKQLKNLLEKLLEKSNLSSEIFPDRIINSLVINTKLWNHSSIRRTPTAVILAASLTLIESLRNKSKEEKLNISPEIAEKWAFLGTSPWYQKYGDLHDVHAEYLLFDGEKYIEIDKHYKHPLP